MPVVEHSEYRPPGLLYNGFLQTVVPGLMRRQPLPPYDRERLELSDGDFVDLDWLRQGSDKLVILTHGLEGSSGSSYMVSAVHALSREGYDLLAWNCRSCSGEINRNKCLYHHGGIEDIEQVVGRASRDYSRIGLIGYSMGGNITLKWLGLRLEKTGLPVRAGMAVSTPADLEGASMTLDSWRNWPFKQYFKYQLKRKLKMKERQFPGWIDLKVFDREKVWREIDEACSAPINRLPSAEAFYKQGSSRNFIRDIEVPTLILNAQNDPVLSPGCHPWEIAEDHEYLHLELTPEGGHVGFPLNLRLESWADRRSVEFFGEWM